MDTPDLTAAPILIATASADDAAQAKHRLEDEFKSVFTSFNPTMAVADFERHRPDVLVLAFDSLEKSERYYLGLYRTCKLIHQHPHRTVILCNKDELKRVYELCRKNYFDDYILFWPMTHDTCRLSMSVSLAMREVASLKASGPTTAQFAAQARRLGELEPILDRRIGEGDQHMVVASRAMEAAERDIGEAIDRFSRRLIEGGLSEAVVVKQADRLEKEIGELKREGVQQRFHAAAEAVAPLKQWAQEFRQDCTPHLEAVRSLNALATRVQPTVLVVDDDDFQRKIIGKILEQENYRTVFATSGPEALTILRKMRPDLILLDVMMPDMNGVEVTRHAKAIPHCANVPVVMVSGKADGDAVVNSIKAGAADFVVKPVHRDTLIAKMDRALHAAASPAARG